MGQEKADRYLWCNRFLSTYQLMRERSFSVLDNTTWTVVVCDDSKTKQECECLATQAVTKEGFQCRGYSK